jgi:hypothetical protein
MHAMTLHCEVSEVAVLNVPAFAQDPNDPNNTVYLGRGVEKVTLEVIPDPKVGGGGKGSLTFQVSDRSYLGWFRPGDKVKVEISGEAV